jgi:hypothetical protein
MAGDDYEVGYRRPPEGTRFKPGQSGNPKGRPKRTQNLRTDLIEELGETIRIREGDREFRVSKQRAILKSLVAKAMKGDTRATTSLVNLCARLLDVADEEDTDRPLPPADQRVLDEYVEREIARRKLSPQGSRKRARTSQQGE